MIRLGHIDYSNCLPVHALLLHDPPPDVRLVHGVPTALNRALAAGSIDAAPCSSIEYPRHAQEYRILPAHAIGSAGAVHSILLESEVPLRELDGRRVAVPTASATSVVLLRALLELKHGVKADYYWFDQTAAGPVVDGTAAALRIGDSALGRTPAPGRHVFDLGTEWFDWTGLPFAFAVWQVRRDVPPAAVRRLATLLAESHAWFATHDERLAHDYATRFGLTPDQLLSYWHSLRFDLDAPMQQGLLHFYRIAAELKEAPATEELDIVVLPAD